VPFETVRAQAVAKRPQGLLRDSLVRFLGSVLPWVADASKASQRLLQRVLSHFTHDESPVVGTRICCMVGPWHPWDADLPAQPHLPEGPKGGGAPVPWSTTGLAVRTLADPSAVEGRAAVGRGVS
jgi:hypothetical protein